MNTTVRKIDSQKPQKDIIEEAAAIIKQGELVAFPTETVYGLGADALLPEGARKIYAAKGRPSDNPLIVHIADTQALKEITENLPPEALRLADAFWPGPLTMILRKNDRVPYETTGGLDTVAVRMPSHKVAAELIRESGGYIAAPSANTSGRPSPTQAEHVFEDLNGKISMILDGGPVGIGLESTIVDLSADVPMILRPGYITKEMLSEVIGKVIDDPGFQSVDPGVHPKAPGMKYKHYAPKADLVLVDGPMDHVIRKIGELAAQRMAEGKKCGIICTDESFDSYDAPLKRSIGSRKDDETIAHNLYAVLREFDDLGADCIYSEMFDTPRMGKAIMNRLIKAAAHQVIEV